MARRVKLVLLGRLADAAGGELAVEAGPWGEVLASLPLALQQALAGTRWRMACNGGLVGDPSTLVLQAGDELALLPPVSGG
ncbi:MoaD/ThiS family protein [Novosphingobium umbonatum]|uniref:MoaD/ThiS family protein n=1 Tax=Novosphingobium umbonatum TaxID=1908524 RepID=A0A3S2VFV6_9SPHN|nr:MoaD/ThiS family protein [Novosphingobium umbonatum]RVU07113.1 MoaD/ThiS family protein [Novosphingobium umbonatum]